jgi:hypothetical protein
MSLNLGHQQPYRSSPDDIRVWSPGEMTLRGENERPERKSPEILRGLILAQSQVSMVRGR